MFVALDDEGKPRPVPPLIAETERNNDVSRRQDPTRDTDRASRRDRRASARRLRAWIGERRVRRRGRLETRDGAVELYRLAAVADLDRLPHRQDPAREPPAPAGTARRLRRRRSRRSRPGRRRPSAHRLPGRRGADAGLHGRPRRGRPRRDALGDGARRRRPRRSTRSWTWTSSSITRSRWTSSGRPRRMRPTSSGSIAATGTARCSMGPAGVRGRPGGSARRGDLPPGEPRASGQGGRAPGRSRPRTRSSGRTPTRRW